MLIKTMEIPNDFNIKDIVYLKTDIDQKPRLVTALLIDENSIIYRLVCETTISDHYGFELSKEKQIF